MDSKVDAILHYIGDWIDDNYGSRVEDCAEDLIRMIRKIGDESMGYSEFCYDNHGKQMEICKLIHDYAEQAYNKGYDSGRETHDKVRQDDINMGYEQGYKDACKLYCEDKEDYNRGLNDAWECAKKIYKMTASEIIAVFGGCSNWVDYSEDEAIAKIKAYEEGGSDVSRNNQ